MIDYDIVVKNNFIIYGTGSVSNRFSMALQKKYSLDNLIGYTRTNVDVSETFRGKPVKNIECYDKKIAVLIAVHISIYKEIERYLDKLGYKNHIWVYPELFNLCYGFPIKTNAIYQTKDIVKCLYPIYTCAIYYMVIEQYFGMNKIGYGLYYKLMKSFCSEQVARERLKQYIERISDADSNGLSQSYAIFLTRDRSIILDGAHRLVLALYFGIPNVLVDLFDVGFDEYMYFSKDMAMVRDKLIEVFTDEEIAAIESKFNEIVSNQS